MSKQIISKQEIIDLLNDMKNEKNESYINQWINKIFAINDNEFQQELNSNNVSTVEEAENFFKDRLPKQKIRLTDLDKENTYFHFTDESSLESIYQIGLRSDIGKHSKGIDKKPSIFFSLGMVPTLQGVDSWIKWTMNKMYGETNLFGIYDGLDESEIKSKQQEWSEEFLNGEYLTDNNRKEQTFEVLYNALKEKIFLTIDDLKPGIDFSPNDIDYNKKSQLDKKKNGDIIPYLYMKEMYGQYSDVDSTVMEKWNIHTYFGAKIEPERIMQITDSKGRTDMLHILMEMYDRYKPDKDFKVDILDDFVSYAKQKEISEEKSTQRLGQETLEEQKDTIFLDEIENEQARHGKEQLQSNVIHKRIH